MHSELEALLRNLRLVNQCMLVFKVTSSDDDTKDSFYEELEGVFDQFPKYHMKILLGDFNAKVGREDIFKLDRWRALVNTVMNLRVP
jgi:hypothetical protein